MLIVYENITKNNKLLSLAIQNKNIKTNIISHPPQRKRYNPNFSFLLKEKNIHCILLKYGGSHDCMVVGFIATYAINAYHH